MQRLPLLAYLAITITFSCGSKESIAPLCPGAFSAHLTVSPTMLYPEACGSGQNVNGTFRASSGSYEVAIASNAAGSAVQDFVRDNLVVEENLLSWTGTFTETVTTSTDKEVSSFPITIKMNRDQSMTVAFGLSGQDCLYIGKFICAD